MATIHISEADAARDLAGLLARVRAGLEVVIEKPASPAVVLRVANEPAVRRLSESLDSGGEHHSSATLDHSFAEVLERITSPPPARRSIEECINLLPADSPATIDENFARDVETAVASHRDPLNPPAWD